MRCPLGPTRKAFDIEGPGHMDPCRIMFSPEIHFTMPHFTMIPIGTVRVAWNARYVSTTSSA